MLDYSYVNSLNSPYFLVIGAMDGISHDHLAPYIRQNKLKGTFVEPVPYQFNKLVNNYKEYDVRFVNCAIGSFDGEDYICHVDFNMFDGHWNCGGSSLKPSKLMQSFDLIKTKVQVKTLKTLIKEQNIEKIDILQIDAEGMDLEIYKQVDFKPSFISIEILNMSDSQISWLSNDLTEKNYKIFNNKSEIIAILNI